MPASKLPPQLVPFDPVIGRQGHYAGAVSRLAAFAADVGISWGLFSLAAAILTFTVQLVSNRHFSLAEHPLLSLIIAVIWEFLYFSYQWSLSGRTLGMAILGIRIVRADGQNVALRQAVIRTIALPLSFLMLGLGFIGVLTNRNRYALHDRLSGTAVVYSWDARAARLRWLAKRSSEPIPSK